MALNDDDKKRVQLGIDWLGKIFGAQNVTEDIISGHEVILVRNTNVLSAAGPAGNVIEWFNKYIYDCLRDRETGSRLPDAPGAIAFPADGGMAILKQHFAYVGVVSALANLRVEQLEFQLERAHMRDRVRVEAGHKRPSPEPVEIAPELAIAALKKVTGCDWVERSIGSQQCYVTLKKFPNCEALSGRMRVALGLENHDWPDLGALADGHVVIARSYITSSNLGLLLESDEGLRQHFGGRSGPPSRT